jgi:hypothetical protein
MKFKFLFVLLLALLVPLTVFADNVVDNVTVGGTDTITAGGSTIVSYKINANGGDGQTGCNASDGSPATVTLSIPAGVTASTLSLTFSACNVFQPVTFSATTAGNYAITVASIVDSGTGAYNNQADWTLHVNAPPDSTPPVITPNIVGTLGNNGWYRSDVNVNWSVVDNESAISSSSGCSPTTISADTAGVPLTCTATSAGGTSSHSVTIKRDATAPTISGSAAPGPNGNGWNNTDVTVSFSCNDGLSGIASCGPNQTLSSEGAGQSVTGTAVDNAGNSATSTVSNINIDKTAPSVNVSVSPPANGAGWNNSTPVTVHFEGSDSGSGVLSCDPDVVLNSETAGQLVTGSCTDQAGNQGSSSVTVKIDTTAPTISGSAAPAANGNGWNNTNVTVSFSCNDGLSGIASCGPNQTLSSEGAGQSVTDTAVDNAGNSATSTVSNINIDKTAPVVIVTGVSNGATYTLGSVPAAGCNTSDALSGVATSATLSSSGGPVGSVTATCSGAVDKAGNTGGIASVTYTVNYNFTGFFQPVDNQPTLNRVKAGSAIPVKFSLGGNQGLTIFANGSPSSVQIGCVSADPVDPIEITVTANASGLQYDASANQYIYVWKTNSAWAGTCRQLVIQLADGTYHRANFNFTR